MSRFSTHEPSRLTAFLLVAATIVAIPAQLGGCTAPSAPENRVTSRLRPDTTNDGQPMPATVATVKGLLKVPATLRLDNGLSFAEAGLISNNAAGFRSLGGLSDFQLQQSASQPLPTSLIKGARVFLADASGQPIPNLMSVTTGPDGSFLFPRVPHGFTFMVVAHIKTATGATAEFRTLVKLTPLGVSTVLSPATTLVTTNLVEEMSSADLGDFKPTKFRSATDAVEKQLTETNAPDFTDAESVRNSIAQLSKDISELKSLITDMRQDLINVQQSLDKLQEAIENSQNANSSSAVKPGAITATTPGTLASSNPTPGLPSSPNPSGLLPPSIPTSQGCAKETRIFRVNDASVTTIELREMPLAAPPGIADQQTAITKLPKILEFPVTRTASGTVTAAVPANCRMVMAYKDKNKNYLGWIWGFRFATITDPNLQNVPFPLPPLSAMPKPTSGSPSPVPEPSPSSLPTKPPLILPSPTPTPGTP